MHLNRTCSKIRQVAVVERKCLALQHEFSDERACETDRLVCPTNHYTKDMVHLRSYELPHEPSIRAMICQAVLATSAATTFFDPVSIGDRRFADGGFGASNLVNEVEGETANIWRPKTGYLKPLAKCFISIGTGNPGKKAFGDSLLGFPTNTTISIATEPEHTDKKSIARRARHFDEKRYFRFDVEQGLQDVGLEEHKKSAIEAASYRYLSHTAQKPRARECNQNFSSKQSVSIEDYS